ncbi:MAG: hypothetical protein JSU94_17090 [Phycisphaerales bacterium]|nr:MAG: hypothetical protein JSU94_17090 [Phycisphaerales bacterium]
MSTGRLYLVMFLAAIGCQVLSVGQDKAVPAGNGTKTGTEVELDPQLKLTRDALLDKGSSDQMRMNAANLLLTNDSAAARKILIEALNQSANVGARVAVCKALGLARASGDLEKVQNKEDFIEPLLGVLANGGSDIAGLAAEATLIFDYAQISEPIDKLIEDTSLPIKAKLNCVYALELRPDMRAAIRLLRLVDSPQEQVAAAAERSLGALGIPAGQDAESRVQIIEELERNGPEAFLSNLLIRQQAQMREIKAELRLWKGKYLYSFLDTIYGLKDDEAKGKFLAENLVDSRAVVRLWALEKVRESRVAPGPQKLPAELEPILIDLISDKDRDIRLKAAEVLSFMVELNSAERLLAQLEAETDEEVKIQLFVALGGSCYYDILSASTKRVPLEVRKKTLEWAAKYLAEEDFVKARRGADVMRKLLEQNGLTAEEVERYLGLLEQRYVRSRNDGDGALRGDLLSAMAGLCAPQSVHNPASKKRFKVLFEEALADKTDLVRVAAVDGLIYIDPADALRQLRKDFVNDSSATVRKRLIVAASKIGGKEDLGWLAAKLGANAEGEMAWQAMLSIFKGSAAPVLSEWMGNIFGDSGTIKLSKEQQIAFLEVAETKASAENDGGMALKVIEKLAGLYLGTGQFQKAETYLLRLQGSAQSVEEKDVILSDLMTVYLRWPKLGLAAKLVDKCLSEKDLDPNCGVVRSIDEYLGQPGGGAEPNSVIKALSAIEINPAASRPEWRKILDSWAARHIGTGGGEASKEAKKPDDGAV